MKLALLSILLIAFISLCTQQPSNLTTILGICVDACKDALTVGRNLDSGPCLLDPIQQYPNWVCDIAHNPRIAEDNLAENQCQAYRNGTAQHYVEIDTSCNLIRTG